MENFVAQVTSLPPAGDWMDVAIRGLAVLGIVAWSGAGTFRRDGSIPSPPDAIAD